MLIQFFQRILALFLTDVVFIWFTLARPTPKHSQNDLLYVSSVLQLGMKMLEQKPSPHKNNVYSVTGGWHVNIGLNYCNLRSMEPLLMFASLLAACCMSGLWRVHHSARDISHCLSIQDMYLAYS